MLFGLFKKSDIQSHINKIKELLNCTEEDAKEMGELFKKLIPGQIKDIVREDDNVGIVMYVYNSIGDKYIVDVTRDFIVEDIYKNDRDGERVYFVMF